MSASDMLVLVSTTETNILKDTEVPRPDLNAHGILLVAGSHLTGRRLRRLHNSAHDMFLCSDQ